ncbi:hypothetical protein OH76DRAFT_1487983 [Lentinus brumalis]|uniref:Uncharacterized protein n=1 Tax=Lentinus brumalis TaxID=2498619 RepID=A0A371CSN2_9APHY|nr:hypothetical protein OH76DRAFT_1487983 [Polyporus brumalis]
MWDSFVNSPVRIAIFVDGIEEYAAENATVGLVSPMNSSEVLLCAIVMEGPAFIRLAADVRRFSGILKVDDTRLGLYGEDGAVCLSFPDAVQLQDFVGSYYLGWPEDSEDDDESVNISEDQNPNGVPQEDDDALGSPASRSEEEDLEWEML